MSGYGLSLLASGYKLRIVEHGDGELWFGVVGEALPQAEALAEAGLLQRSWCPACHDNHWRLTDAGAAVVEARNAEIAACN